MSKFSRDKGKRGEREVAALIKDLTGWDVKRKVRNLAGESDLEGVPGWSVEVKNHAKLDVAAWWRQAVAQAMFTKDKPVLFYKVPRKGWRALWPLAVALELQPGEMDYWLGHELTADTTITGWAAVARESAR